MTTWRTRRAHMSRPTPEIYNPLLKNIIQMSNIQHYHCKRIVSKNKIPARTQFFCHLHGGMGPFIFLAHIKHYGKGWMNIKMGILGVYWMILIFSTPNHHHRWLNDSLVPKTTLRRDLIATPKFLYWFFPILYVFLIV